MRGRNKIFRKKKSFYRWFALFMLAVLIMNESGLSVLAEENNSDENICICESRCGEDIVNADCPVCMESYENCVYSEVVEPGEGDEGDSEGENPGTDDGTDGKEVELPGELEQPEESELPEEPELPEESELPGELEQPEESELPGEPELPEESELPEKPELSEQPVTLENSGEMTEVQEAETESYGDEGIETYADVTFFPDNKSGFIYAMWNDGRVEISGLLSGEDISGTLEIPETMEKEGVTYTVSGIYSNAFLGCKNLECVVIPDSVTRIGYGAFKNCESLKDIKIPDGVTEIGYEAFCQSGLESIVIPDGVTKIEMLMFERCRDLKDVKMSNNITDIEYGAFSGCNSLDNIIIPDKVTSIGDFAFYVCSNLRSLIIPDSVTEIGDSAFAGCTGLESVKISNNVTCLEQRTFDRCSSLKNIEFPNSLTSIGAAAFRFCDSLESIRIPDGVTSIGTGAFSDCLGLKSIELPNSVTYMDRSVFARCAELNTLRIVVPADGSLSVPKLGEYVFDKIASDRSIIFVAEDGTELTGDALKAAQAVYKSDESDGNTIDDFWWGWKIGSEGVATQTFQITYYLDGYIASPEKSSYTYGSEHQLPAPEKDGFDFDGWYENAEYSGSKVSFIGSTETGVKIYYGRWIGKAVTDHTIVSTAEEGGRISPEGNISVVDGGEQIFEITPNDGYRIKTVMVDGADVTGELIDSVARAVTAQAGTSRYYIFSDVRNDHTIHVTFEAENGGETGNGSGGTGETDGDGSDSGNSGADGDGSGEAGGDSNDSGSDGTVGDNSNGGTDESDNGSIETVGNNGFAEDNNAIGANGNAVISVNSADSVVPSKNAEPKTGESSHVEIYATVTMIAGLTYLLLYFADLERGMSEEEKKEIVMSLIRWAKRGHRLRRYVVMVPIFILLFYYHSIGKRVHVKREENAVWG